MAHYVDENANEPTNPATGLQDGNELTKRIYARTLLVFNLDAGHPSTVKPKAPPALVKAVQNCVESTTERVVVILVGNAFAPDRSGAEAQSHLSPTALWDDVQRLLVAVYVEATRIAHVAGRILLDIDVILRSPESVANLAFNGAEWNALFCAGGYIPEDLPDWMSGLPRTQLLYSRPKPAQNEPSSETPSDPDAASRLPYYPVVALGGTFDHLHAGHKILLSMAAWIAQEKVIVGVTDDALLTRKANAHLLESLPLRISRVRGFLELFKPGLVYEVVPINDVYGPTATDANIQALVVSKETMSGGKAVSDYRTSHDLCPLETFVIDVISAASSDRDAGVLDSEDIDVLRSAKMSSTFIRQWISENTAKSD